MPTDATVNSLVINIMTPAQYESSEKNRNELYLVEETPASTTSLGPVKVDGTTITVTEDGTISAAASSSSSSSSRSAVPIVTTIDSSATDDTVPSAKAVYDLITEIKAQLDEIKAQRG